MIIPSRFQNQINTHLLGNMLEIDDYPLILSIIGSPGMGKTWQLRKHLEKLGISVFSISSADLESDRAGAPAKLLKEQYVKASISISQKKPAAIVIDDIDTTVGEWERNTGTVNHQGILAFLMHIADHPYYIENVGKTNRVPVFLTGNNFELLYEPLRRTGRMLKFDWEPTLNEKIDIVDSVFWFANRNVAEMLVNAFPTEPISFFSSFLTTSTIDQLTKLVTDTTFDTILTDSEYKIILFNTFNEKRKNIDWMKVIMEYISKGEERGNN